MFSIHMLSLAWETFLCCCLCATPEGNLYSLIPPLGGPSLLPPMCDECTPGSAQNDSDGT